MKLIPLLFLFVVFLGEMHANAEIVPKTKTRGTTIRLKPKNVHVKDPHEKPPAHGLTESSLSVLIVTPLIKEVFPEKRFTAFGNLVQLSLPVWNLNPEMAIHAEGGFGISAIRLTLTQPSTSFTHLFLLFPLRARGVYAFSERVHLEMLLGILLRPWEYDSRDTTDGGFHSVSSGAFQFDFGTGFSYAFTPSFWGRFLVGYQQMGLGFALLL